MQMSTMWAKELIKLDDIKIFDLKKGIGIEWSDSSLVKKENEQVKILRHAGTDGNFLCNAHTTEIPILTSQSIICM